jgi:LytR cell envelope-related transcriptional attenuator
MPAYTVHRPSVLRSGRLGVRAAALVALLAAAAVAFVFVTRALAAHSSPAAQRSSHTAAKTATKHRAAGTHAAAKPKAKTHVAKKPTHRATTVKKKVAIPTPAHTPVAVLNGGTAQGAAAATASKLRSLGYPVPLVGNAGSRNLPSAIEYTQGLGAAARALARKIGPVSYVTPFDGPVRNLSGARLLVIIGS